MSLETIYQAVLDGDAPAAEVAVKDALAASVPAEDILQKACIPAMGEVGRLFEEGEKFVPEMLISARAMQKSVALLKPLLAQGNVQSVGKVVVGTVQGDLHDIGKNLVRMMLEGAGFEVIDLGTDVTPHKFVEAVRQHNPQLVGMSALLTTTMPSMKKCIEALQEAGLRGQVKVLIGGAPVTEAYANQIGADGYAPDASSAARKAKALVATKAST
jgi:5-methyltetrahydrofolate--homocysteine methyltransferase